MRRLVISGLLLGAACGAASAADRCVLAEEFTATWCVYCPPVGLALSALQDQHPQNLAFYQIHGDDAYEITWGNTRAAFYGLQGYPTTEMDGVLERIGQYPTPQYTTDFNSRAAIPTDVTIHFWATQVDADSWTVTARVGVEAGGQSHDAKIRILQILDHYPAGEHYRNCLMQVSPQTVTTLTPGNSTDVSYTFNLNAASMASINNVGFVVFAQNTGNPPTGSLVYQSAIMMYPFNAPPQAPGDANGDGHVNLTDLATVLTSFGMTSGGTWAQGDFDADGDVDLTDLSTLLSHFGS